MKHFIDIADVTDDELHRLFEAALSMRAARQRGEPAAPVLAGRTYAMVFEKPSLRTRASIEQAVVELGGHALNLAASDVGIALCAAAKERILGEHWLWEMEQGVTSSGAGSITQFVFLIPPKVN